MRQQTLLAVGICAWLVLASLGALVVLRRNPRALDADDIAAPPPSMAPTTSAAPARTPSATPPSTRHLPSAATHHCRRTHGASAQLTTDDRGYTCAPAAVDSETDCCSEWSPRYACTQCTTACCVDYAQCVACCMGAATPFARCSTLCRTSSHSLEPNAGYALPDTRFCWRTPASPSPSKRGASKILDLHE